MFVTQDVPAARVQEEEVIATAPLEGSGTGQIRGNSHTYQSTQDMMTSDGDVNCTRKENRKENPDNSQGADDEYSTNMNDGETDNRFKHRREQQETDAPLHTIISQLSVGGNDDKLSQKTPTSSNDLLLKHVFPIKKLPDECQSIIFTFALIIPHDGKCPTLLAAFAGAENKMIYEEARRIYMFINRNITSANVEELKRLPFSTLCMIRYVRIIFPLRFDAHKLQLKNNIDTMIFDIVGVADIHTTSLDTMFYHLAPASTCLRSVLLKTLDEGDGVRPAKSISGIIGFEPVKEIVENNNALYTWESSTILELSGRRENRGTTRAIRISLEQFRKTRSDYLD